MGKVSAVLFDLDQTLLDRVQSLELFLDCQWHQRRGLQKVSLAAFRQKFVMLDARDHVWKDAVYASLLRDFGIDTYDVDELVDEYLVQFCNHARLFPGTLAGLQVLRRQGVKFGIITNGRTDLQTRVVEASGLGELMKCVLISEAEGIRKPDPRIFNLGLERLGMPAKACVFVGDHPVADIGGAHGVGMRTVWKKNVDFEAPATAVTTAVFETFAELPEILGALKFGALE